MKTDCVCMHAPTLNLESFWHAFISVFFSFSLQAFVSGLPGQDLGDALAMTTPALAAIDSHQLLLANQQVCYLDVIITAKCAWIKDATVIQNFLKSRC